MLREKRRHIRRHKYIVLVYMTSSSELQYNVKDEFIVMSPLQLSW